MPTGKSAILWFLWRLEVSVNTKRLSIICLGISRLPAGYPQPSGWAVVDNPVRKVSPTFWYGSGWTMPVRKSAILGSR